MSTKRKYVSDIRATRALETRASIQKSARRLLVENGFDGTTVSAIAADAGVSSQTIFSVFGSKGAIVASMLEHIEEQAGEADAVESLATESDPRRQLRIFTSWIRRLFELSSDVFTVILQSPDQPDMASILDTGNERRLAGCKHLASMWNESGVLRGERTAEMAAEQLWLLTSVETYLNCTTQLGWSPERYEQWVTDSAERLLFS
jgi:TetR/AcrR family transcriptional regulator, regulator of cefoperazone and chloramphenicol sensitivity